MAASVALVYRLADFTKGDGGPAGLATGPLAIVFFGVGIALLSLGTLRLGLYDLNRLERLLKEDRARLSITPHGLGLKATVRW